MTLIPKTISRRLQVYIATATCLVLMLTTWISYESNRDSLNQQTNREALKQVQAAVSQLDDFLNRVGQTTRSLAIRQTAFGHEPDPGLVPISPKCSRTRRKTSYTVSTSPTSAKAGRKPTPWRGWTANPGRAP